MTTVIINNGSDQVQYNPGMQPGATNGNQNSFQQALATVLGEIEQMLQNAPQAGGSAPASGTTPTGQNGGQQLNAQSASGALASYMGANNVQSLNPNQLYALAYNPPANATPTDSAAAKFMLQNPGVFNQIETHDVAGSDGIAGANDFQWAAQGGMGGAGGTGGTGGTGGAPGGSSNTGSAPPLSSFGGGSNTGSAPPTQGFAGGFNGGLSNTIPLGHGPVVQTPPNGGTQNSGGQQFNAQSASGALASYMSANNTPPMDPNQLYQLAYNPPANATPTDSAAAKWMLQNPSVYNQIETHDVAGSDGVAGANDFQWAAQGGMGQGGSNANALS